MLNSFTYTKTIVRTNKKKINIKVNVFFNGTSIKWAYNIYIKDYGSNVWQPSTRNYPNNKLLKMELNERKELIRRLNLIHVTEKEIREALIEAWASIKPNIREVIYCL